MNRMATSIQVKPYATIPLDVWDAFTSEYSRCSSIIQLPADFEGRSKTLSAVMMGSILEQIISWQCFSRLYEIYEELGQLSKLQTAEVRQFIAGTMRVFNLILAQLRPFSQERLSRTTQQGKQAEIIQEYLRESRKFIYEKLTTEEGIDQLATLSHGIALLLYLRNDYDNQNLKRYVDKKSRSQIIKELIQHPIEDPKNFFVLEDYEVLALSHLLNVPIHFYINYYEKKGAGTLTKRRIHSPMNDEKTVAFILEFNKAQIAQSVRILYLQHDSAYVKHIHDSSKNQNQYVIDALQYIQESTLNQVTTHCSQINQFWIKKIVEIIQNKDTDTLVAKRDFISLPRHLQDYCTKLFEMMNCTQLTQFLENLQIKLNLSLEMFENIVISQITSVRDSIQNIHKQPEKIIANELPQRPKILSNNNLFQQKMNGAFILQKQLSENGRISAKQVDQDIPDIQENYPEMHSAKVEDYQTSSEDELPPPNYIELLKEEQPSLVESQILRPPQFQMERGRQTVSMIDAVNIEERRSERKKSTDTLAFNPSSSRKSLNIQKKMSQSQNFNSVMSQRNQVVSQIQQNQSHITEVDEVSQSQICQFECPTCYELIINPDEITTIHDEHRICNNCLQTWIKVKFNAGQWNFKFFRCPIQIKHNQKMLPCDHNIDQNQIKSTLSPEEYRKLCEQAIKNGIIDINCPHCSVTIRGMTPKGTLYCPECKGKICWVCKKVDHQGSKCPQRLDEIKNALQDERVACCPECLEIYMKNDGCEHVQCTNCLIDFCFSCSAPRDPIEAHGAHYHREGCQWRVPWFNPTTKKEILDNEFDPDQCQKCRTTKKECVRPISLRDFQQLAHIDF